MEFSTDMLSSAFYQAGRPDRNGSPSGQVRLRLCLETIRDFYVNIVIQLKLPEFGGNVLAEEQVASAGQGNFIAVLVRRH